MVPSYPGRSRGASLLLFGVLSPVIATAESHFQVGMHKFALRDPISPDQQLLSLGASSNVIFNPRPAVCTS